MHNGRKEDQSRIVQIYPEGINCLDLQRREEELTEIMKRVKEENYDIFANSKAVLNLNLDSFWYTATLLNLKSVEFREMSNYWCARILGNNFNYVCFRLGFSRSVCHIRKLVQIATGDAAEIRLSGEIALKLRNGAFEIVTGEIVYVGDHSEWNPHSIFDYGKSLKFKNMKEKPGC